MFEYNLQWVHEAVCVPGTAEIAAVKR